MSSTFVLQHELYIPLVSQLNDPADGRPKLAELTADQLFDFLTKPRAIRRWPQTRSVMLWRC
jgi:hypothetical protein